ncbi:MAG: transposase [Polyangiaceae bacterium]|nr:transposase [Polyangiaceae bacterium]
MAKRHSREFWARLIGEVERGGGVEAVARRHGVRPRTLIWWRWRLGQGPRRSGRKAQLLPVVVRGAPVTFERPALVELAVRDVALRLETGTDVDYIATLVAALRSSC